jgi:hypothetical protein
MHVAARYARNTKVKIVEKFLYSTGEVVELGDLVTIIGKQATIETIILGHTQEASDFKCFETGGLLIAFANGDLQLWPWCDEDLVFVSRQHN